LNRLAEHSPNRYRQETDRRHCPLGESYASRFSLDYRLRSSKEIDWRFQRNVLFLQDYMRSDSGAIPASAQARIASYACAVPGISLAELIDQIVNFATRDDVYLLIATCRLYANLHTRLLVEATVRVFPYRGAALQHGAGQNALPVLHSLLPPFQTLRARATNTWGGPRGRSPRLGVR
jgi:putative transposase